MAEKFDDMYSHLDTIHNWTDRLTDRQTDRNGKTISHYPAKFGSSKPNNIRA